MTKVWARELGRFGIRVNAVAPRFTAPEILRSMPEKIIDAVKSKTPLRRLGKPRKIANAYLFLASEEASFITGTVLHIDGGTGDNVAQRSRISGLFYPHVFPSVLFSSGQLQLTVLAQVVIL